MRSTRIGGRRVAAVALATCLSAVAHGQILNPNNGHYYQEVHVPAGVTWTQAHAMASSMTFMGVQGHLATFTSASEMNWFAEDQFLTFIVSLNQEYWIGGLRTDRTGAPSTGWEWVTGETWSYTNWSTGEPNNLGGNEFWLKFWTWDGVVGRWNDDIENAPTTGFVVEFPVPAPGAGALAGVAALAAARRRRS